METTKNTLIRAASIMMAICACVAIIISAFNIFITTGLVGNLSADQSAMIELESQLEGLLSADQAVGIFSACWVSAICWAALWLRFSSSSEEVRIRSARCSDLAPLSV